MKQPFLVSAFICVCITVTFAERNPPSNRKCADFNENGAWPLWALGHTGCWTECKPKTYNPWLKASDRRTIDSGLACHAYDRRPATSEDVPTVSNIRSPPSCVKSSGSGCGRCGLTERRVYCGPIRAPLQYLPVYPDQEGYDSSYCSRTESCEKTPLTLFKGAGCLSENTGAAGSGIATVPSCPDGTKEVARAACRLTSTQPLRENRMCKVTGKLWQRRSSKKTVVTNDDGSKTEYVARRTRSRTRSAHQEMGSYLFHDAGVDNDRVDAQYQQQQLPPALYGPQPIGGYAGVYSPLSANQYAPDASDSVFLFGILLIVFMAGLLVCGLACVFCGYFVGSKQSKYTNDAYESQA